MARRESFSIAGIEDLSKPELEVIKVLAKWNYQISRPTLRALSRITNYSYSYISLAINNLRERGIIKKSLGGVIHLQEEIRARVLAELETEEKAEMV